MQYLWHYWHHCGITAGILPGPLLSLTGIYLFPKSGSSLSFIHEVFNYNNHLLAYFIFPASFHSSSICITALPSDNKDSDLPNLLPIKNNSDLHRLSSTSGTSFPLLNMSAYLVPSDLMTCTSFYFSLLTQCSF